MALRRASSFLRGVERHHTLSRSPLGSSCRKPLALASSSSSSHVTWHNFVFSPLPNANWHLSIDSAKMVSPPIGLHVSPHLPIQESAEEGGTAVEGARQSMTVKEMRRFLRLAQVEEFKNTLEKHESMRYKDFLELCRSVGLVSSLHEAALFTKVLDSADVIIHFRDIVYLSPKKVAQGISQAIPIPLASSHSERALQELASLEKEKKEIDTLAYKHAWAILWSGLGYMTLQAAILFRLTFWELSWDVMEPIAFFVTSVQILIGYAFYMLTSKHPTYQGITKTLFSSKQSRLMKKRSFNMDRLLELQRQCRSSSSTCDLIWHQTSSNHVLPHLL